MCFKNLPIEFDEQGRAYLKEGVEEPFAYKKGSLGLVGHGSGVPALRGGADGDGGTEFTIDPVTRVAGALGFHTRCDLKERKVTEAHSYATLFRGYEVILKGRDPRDAIDISSRACGVCGGVHATCSSLNLEMAFGIAPPPMGVVARSLGEAAEFLYDHPLILYLLGGPDYSERTVRATNPELWEAAQRTSAPHKDIHGFQAIGEILTALNPLSGKLYLEALEITRLAREMCVLMYGKYPHPSTLVPGGVSTLLEFTSFNNYYTRLVKLIDYSKKIVAIWDDVFDFFLAQNPEYAKVGIRPKNLIETGGFDDPEAYDATYANCNEWGERRWATPGVIVDGELRTTKLQQINLGIEEFVEHSFYREWHREGQLMTTDPAWYGPRELMKTDPAGNPISPYHMWNKRTLPRPSGRTWREKYTWDTAPRWDRTVMETGCYARIWTTALARKMPENPFIVPTGHSLRMLLPKSPTLPEMELEWKIPDSLNAIERNRGRAYCVPWMCLIAMNNVLKAFELLRAGQTKTATPFKVPKDRRVSVGFWFAGRGTLTHHMIMDNGKIENYQIVTPSTWNASPADPFGQPGAYEQAVLNSPILEQYSTPEEFKGIDIQRAIRSFDPCMPCTTHIYAGNRVIVRDVTSCACTLDESDLLGSANEVAGREAMS